MSFAPPSEGATCLDTISLFFLPLGKAHLLRKSVEERGPVRIAITDTIVAIGVQRAGIATIVSVAN
jgi:hypothetical protein